MTVYVDELMNHGWRLGPSCHLTADSEEELVNFADRLGLKREWIQRGTLTHFDLTRNKRSAAVRLGAIELSREAMVERIRKVRRGKCHVLDRTSPKGEDFVGRCCYCGAGGLPMSAAMLPCTAGPDDPATRLDRAIQGEHKGGDERECERRRKGGE